MLDSWPKRAARVSPEHIKQAKTKLKKLRKLQDMCSFRGSDILEALKFISAKHYKAWNFTVEKESEFFKVMLNRWGCILNHVNR